MQFSRSPELKRKRTMSNTNSPDQPKHSSNENHFLYQKFLEKELEIQKSRNASLEADQISRQNLTPQFPAQNQFIRHPVTMQPRQMNPTGFYAINTGTTAGQAHPKDSFTGQAHPTGGMTVPVPGWTSQMGPTMQWGSGQEFFPANQ